MIIHSSNDRSECRLNHRTIVNKSSSNPTKQLTIFWWHLGFIWSFKGKNTWIDEKFTKYQQQCIKVKKVFQDFYFEMYNVFYHVVFCKILFTWAILTTNLAVHHHYTYCCGRVKIVTLTCIVIIEIYLVFS